MANPIERDAAKLVKILFEKSEGGDFLDGSDLVGPTGFSADQLNDAIDYLDSRNLIDRHDFIGTHPYVFGLVKLNVNGKQFYYGLPGETKDVGTNGVGTDAPEKVVKEIFVSYSWDSEHHQMEVHGFVNFLRENGFDVEIDKMISQRKTSVNLGQMMHEAMQSYEKVIIILSNGYKQKADQFKGGVGTEYRLLINDIQKNPNKYILFSFDELTDDIIPFGLAGNDVVIRHTDKWQDRLFSKLTGQHLYEFSPVAKAKPVIEPVRAAVEKFPLGVFGFRVMASGSSAAGRLFKSLEYECQVVVQNVSPGLVESYHLEVFLFQFLHPDYHELPRVGSSVQLTFDMQKIYPTQTVYSPKFPVWFRHGRHISNAINSSILVKVYTAKNGVKEFSFPVRDHFKVNNGFGIEMELSAADFMQ